MHEHFFVPYDFRSMLEFIDLKIKREHAMDQINTDGASNSDTNFKKLFFLNQVNQESSLGTQNKALKSILLKSQIGKFALFYDGEVGYLSPYFVSTGSKILEKINKKKHQNTFLVTPNEVLLKKEEIKIKKLIETAKVRGRILARKEWQSRSCSRSGSKTSLKMSKFGWLNIITIHNRHIIDFLIASRPRTQAKEAKLKNL